MTDTCLVPSCDRPGDCTGQLCEDHWVESAAQGVIGRVERAQPYPPWRQLDDDEFLEQLRQEERDQLEEKSRAEAARKARLERRRREDAERGEQDRETKIVEGRMRAIVDELARTEHGRNNALWSAAKGLGRMVAGGSVTEDRAKEELEEAAAATGLKRREYDAVIDRGLKKGAETPWDPADVLAESHRRPVDLPDAPPRSAR